MNIDPFIHITSSTSTGESFYLKYLCKINELEPTPLLKDEEMEAMRDQLLQEVLKDYQAIIGNTGAGSEEQAASRCYRCMYCTSLMF